MKKIFIIFLMLSSIVLANNYKNFNSNQRKSNSENSYKNECFFYEGEYFFCVLILDKKFEVKDLFSCTEPNKDYLNKDSIVNYLNEYKEYSICNDKLEKNVFKEKMMLHRLLSKLSSEQKNIVNSNIQKLDSLKNIIEKKKESFVSEIKKFQEKEINKNNYNVNYLEILFNMMNDNEKK